MSGQPNIPSEPDWERFRESMGYSKQDLDTFRSFPNHEYVVRNAARLDQWLIVAEVIESHGCSAQHHVGDKLYLSPHGLLEARSSPSRICLQAISPLSTAIAAFAERIIAGLEPNPYLFDRVGCLDVGLKCGGWGHIAFKLYAVPRE